MRKHIYIYLSILIYLLIMSSVSYGCEIDEYPEAIFSYSEWCTASGTSLYFDGSGSKDPDDNPPESGITDYGWWVGWYNGSYYEWGDEPDYYTSSPNIYFDKPGYYIVELDVWDDDGASDYAYCDIVVIGVASISPSETTVAVGDSVSYTVATSPYDGLQSYVNTVWRDSPYRIRGLTIGVTTYPISFSTAGVYAVTASIGNTTTSPSSTTKVVQVDKVKLAGTSDYGPLYVSLGTTVYLETELTPSGASYPENEPTWTFDSKPAGSVPHLDYDSYYGRGTRIVSNLTYTGEYVLRAKYGSGASNGDTITITVINVNVTSPAGSLDASPNPSSSWVSSPCYHFDFQGLTSGATGSYVLTINGNITPIPPTSYKWTLNTAAGTLTNDTTATPTHTAPATTGEGMLRLKAMDGTVDTGFSKERKVKIYEDHLARDYANFGTGGSCLSGWKITTFNVSPQPTMSTWNCHGSTRHAYDGVYNSSSTGQPWLSWNVKTVVVTTHDSSGNGSHPSLGTLERGDVVAYFSPNGKPYNPPNISDLSSWVMQHSQTCTGNGDETYGANNEPKSFPGAPGEGQSWKWATSPAGDWGIHIWQPSLQGSYVPFIIVVFDKP